MTKGRAQVVRYGIRERFQLSIYGFEGRRASRQFLVESLNMLTPMFALGDIANRTRDHPALFPFQRTEVDRHPNRRPSSPPRVQLNAPTQRTVPTIGKEPPAV